MNLNVIAKDLFNKIRGRFSQVTLGDSQGKQTTEPTEARFFDFDFKEGGNTLGKVSISISEEDGLVIMHSKDFVEGTDEPLKRGWFNFLKEMRDFAKARVLGFDTRDITKSNLEKRDYDFLGQGKEVETVSESNLYGTTKTSFQTVGEARLVIKHSAPVNPTVAGGRTHRIESLFIENKAGERFKYPFKHLNGARAMARHVSEGGNPFDDFGKHISEMSAELNQLRKFKTYMNRSNVMAEGLKKYQSVVDERIEEIKTDCLKLQKQTAYKESFEGFSTTELAEVPEDIKKSWIDELTIKTFNEELQDVFPYIYKLVSERTAIEELGPDSFEAHGYQGSIEPRTLRYDLAGDYDQDRGVSDRDAEDVKNLLSKAGINADVQPDESRHQGIVIHTDSNPDDVEKVLGGMIETVDNFHEFESAMESIVREDNGLFSQDADEQAEALEQLNQLMTKHFPAGVNGTNGIESLQGIIDDEELNDEIQKAAREDSDICIRPMIMDYVAQKDPTLVSKINTGDMKTDEKESTVKEMGDAETEISDGIFVVQRGDNADGVSDEDPYVIGELYADPELSAEEIQKTLQDYVQSKNLAPKVDFRPESGRRPDDSGSSVIDGKAYRGEVVMNWLGDKPNEEGFPEGTTFADITPYVSSYKDPDPEAKGKMVYDVLGKDEKSVFKTHNKKEALKYLAKNFDKLRYSEVQKENPETDYDGSMDYEFTGDDGEMAYGTLHYKAVNGKVDPNSLRGESEYNGNHKVDDEFATDMVKPGGSDHEEALKAAQEDYDYESDRMRSKFGMEDQEEKSFKDKEQTVEEFVKSFFDYTSNQFPKGETAVLTSVEKKFGDSAVATAQETIQNLMANKDPEIAKIKKLAGVQ
jgi:hypothetical protein